MPKKEQIVQIVISEIDLYIINKVKELRDNKQISQLELSIMMELAEGTIGKIENPKQRAKYNIRHLNLLAKALKCSPKDLMPEKPLRNDMVRVTYRINKRNRPNKESPYFEILKVEPIE